MYMYVYIYIYIYILLRDFRRFSPLKDKSRLGSPRLPDAYCGQSAYEDSGFQRVLLKHNHNSKGWNSQAHRGFPGKLESNVSRRNVSKEIRTNQMPACGLWTQVCMLWCCGAHIRCPETNPNPQREDVYICVCVYIYIYVCIYIYIYISFIYL